MSLKVTSFWVEATGLDLHFRPGMGENKCSHQFLNRWQQMPTGHLHINGFESCTPPKNNPHPNGWGLFFAKERLKVV